MSAKFETFGKYVLLEKLATGGMAEVFLARGSGAGGIAKFFAIKRILPQFSDSPEFIEMFKDEAKIAINLSHSNIVSIHEFDIKNNQFGLVMDYVEGRNLRQILNKMKKGGMQFSIDQIVFMIKEVAAGLDHAHRCLDGSTGKPLNITHRDMSPQNVMVSFEGEVKIVDFGIAKAESQIETTRAGTLKGKFGYMSPEQAEGQAVDLRTDIFSLGIVMWELLANDRLFMANNEINTLRKIRDCQIPSLRKINPNIHSELERIVMKALARDRNLRYQTCAALHRDLNRFLNRQYPDFAPQDFSVFIKSVFADEILSLRKRLQEFSKITVQPGADANQQPMSAQWADKTRKTSLINTQTSSLINTTTDSKAGPTGLQINTGVTPPGSETKTTPSLDNLSIREKSQVHTEPVFNLPDKLSPATLDIPEITSPSISRNSQARFTRSQPIPKRRRSVPVASMLLVAFCMFIGYAALVKMMPTQMSGVVVALDPYIGPVHRVMGVQSETETASVRPVDPRRNVSEVRPPAQALNPPPIETPKYTPPPVQEIAANPPTPIPEVDTSSSMTSNIVITSNPSGGEIFIDGQSTGLITPTRVQVPMDRPFKLSIKKRGYAEYARGRLKREDLGNKLEAVLIKSSMAYIDVDVVPPTAATLYLNGVAVTDASLPLRNYAVPAGVELKLKAQDANHNSSEEMTVTLPQNKRRLIQLFLKKRH